MIAFFNILADVTVVVVLALALRLGGRYERCFALLVLAGWIAGQAAQRLLHDYLPLPAVFAIEISYLSGCLWLLWRTRPGWLVLATACQLGVIALATIQALRLSPSIWVFFHGVAVLNYVQLGALTWAVLRRQFGPPFPAVEAPR